MARRRAFTYDRGVDVATDAPAGLTTASCVAGDGTDVIVPAGIALEKMKCMRKLAAINSNWLITAA
jgi:hypothetical protein